MADNADLERIAILAPKLGAITRELLFDDIWQSDILGGRERSLITLATLTALGRVEQLPFHLALAHRNGLSREELAEAFTHLAFYTGWPAAVSALSRLAEREEQPCL
ncbi:carboxymuconolactone decarboxylase family protein [Microbulbifer taiwanensis]|uniref:Carboxymuconolactone decarboxylase family protein n=1 Tax=Microbulbifer taiwanensis TaxID=986746 RepID=A0ABW1YM83_9GAMM|nr:carboxymuconolactone decarboxylase family protein [Microbulbifer taiwanensis]